MSLFTKTLVPDWFYVVVINTTFMSLYVDNFINNTSHFQINDARQVPIVLPNDDQLAQARSLFENAYSLKRQQLCQQISEDTAQKAIDIIEKQIEGLVRKIYQI